MVQAADDLKFTQLFSLLAVFGFSWSFLLLDNIASPSPETSDGNGEG
jgi:hypothetical protein